MKSSRLKIQGEIIAALVVFSELNHIYIGYSGGVDSHVLLDSCASLPELKLKITVVYIHHGLQKEADDWASHCRKIAEKKVFHFWKFVWMQRKLMVKALKNQLEMRVTAHLKIYFIKMMYY